LVCTASALADESFSIARKIFGQHDLQLVAKASFFYGVNRPTELVNQ